MPDGVSAGEQLLTCLCSLGSPVVSCFHVSNVTFPFSLTESKKSLCFFHFSSFELFLSLSLSFLVNLLSFQA